MALLQFYRSLGVFYIHLRTWNVKLCCLKTVLSLRAFINKRLRGWLLLFEKEYRCAYIICGRGSPT